MIVAMNGNNTNNKCILNDNQLLIANKQHQVSLNESTSELTMKSTKITINYTNCLYFIIKWTTCTI